MNNKTPKLRFKGFTDAWEQRKVGELIVESKEKGHTGEQARKLTVKLWGNGVVPKLDKGSKNTQYFIRHKEQFIYSKLDFLNAAFGVIPEELDGFESTADLPTFDCNGIDPYFLFHVVSQPSFYIKNGIIANGSRKAKRIHQETFFAMPIVIPTREEQVRISYFISKLDNLITLHQRKLEKIKSLKKAYLDKMFPKKGKLYPELRFAGFTNAWEQRKLDTLASFSKGSGYSKGDLKNVGTPIILYGRLYTKYETVISDVDTFAEAKEGSVYSKGGEVIVPASGETAEDISVASVVEKQGILLGGDLNIITPKKELDSAFLALSISFGEPHKEMSKMAQGKSVVHLHNSDMAKIVLSYPSYDEQRKISRFFSEIDNLITLHQRKLEKLKQLKTGYLNSMFI